MRFYMKKIGLLFLVAILVQTGCVSLHDSVIKNDYETISKILAESTVDINNPDPVSGKTPLITAIEKNDLKMVKILIDSGASVNFTVNPLITAIKTTNQHLIKFILERNPNIENVNKEGKLPLVIALETKNIDCIKLLLNQYTNTGLKQSVFLTASEYGNNEVLQLFLDNGVDIHFTNSSGKNPLMFAASSGNNTGISFFIQKGESVNQSDKNGKTVLMMAADTGNLETVKLLVRNGADVSAKMDDKITALMIALLKKNDDIIKYLRKNGSESPFSYKIPSDMGLNFFRYQLNAQMELTGLDNNDFVGIIMSENQYDNTIIVLARKQSVDIVGGQNIPLLRSSRKTTGKFKINELVCCLHER